MSEGNLLGHFIAKRGIRVDIGLAWTIIQIPHPLNKKAMQSFLGKINFLRKLIYDYTQITKLIQEMVKKDAIFKWDNREKDTFSHIKKSIVETSTL